MSQDWSTIAYHYDYFTHLTGQFASRMVDLVKIQMEKNRFSPPITVLDIACGTGIVPITFVEKMKDQVTVLATDLEEQMVNITEQKILASNIVNIQTKAMDGQALPLEDESFNVCTNLFGLIFFPDQAKGFKEMHRVLRTDKGMAIVGGWVSLDLMEVGVAIGKHFKKETGQALMRGLSLSDKNRFASMMQTAGFKDVHVEEMAVLWLVDDKARFEAFIINNPILNQQVDKQELAKALPQILLSVFPNYIAGSTFQVRGVANIGYGFK